MADLVTEQEVIDAWPGFAALPAARRAQLIDAATAKAGRYCRRAFTLGAVTETFDGDDSDRVWLSQPPVASIQSVTINGSALDNTGNAAWRFSSSGILTLAGGAPLGVGNIVVAYTGGFSPIPADLKEYAIARIKRMVDRSAKSGAFKSESLGDYSYTMNDLVSLGLSDLETEYLEPYVLKRFA